jgi:tRNA(Ser,Leu) C12 N-acetylase TAN1
MGGPVGGTSANLLVSCAWRAPGRSRREILARLRELGDPAAVVGPSGRKGILAVRTSLDPRTVIRGLRAVQAGSPGLFRYTCKWAPVDLWAAPDLDSLRQGTARLADRIAPGERWRVTVERRRQGGPSTAEIIATVAALIPERVDLGDPNKILRIEVFDDQAALSVVTPEETLSIVAPAPAHGTSQGPPPMPPTLDALAGSVEGLSRVLVDRVAGFVRGSARPFKELVDLALELLGGIIPAWPLLTEWNDWCLREGASFFVWRPAHGELPERTRAEALIHTIMMLSGKEQAIRDYRASGIEAAEVAMAGDDCVVCDQHRHRVVPLDGAAVTLLPPFHPGCRCGVLPRLD